MASGVPLSSLATGVEWLQLSSGLLQAGATRSVYVYRRGTTTQVQVYSDQGLTLTLSQPLTTDSGGNVPGYIAAEQQIDFFDALTSKRAQAEPLSVADLIGSDGKVGGSGSLGLPTSVLTTTTPKLASAILLPSGDATGATDAAALVAAYGFNKKVVLAPGQFYLTATSLNATSLEIVGSGKGVTLINIVGGGIGLQIGPTYPAAVTANANIRLGGFTLQGNGTATCGIRMSRMQGFRFDDIDVTGFTAAGASAWNLHSCNSGLLVNCDGRGSSIGVLVDSDADSASSSPNLIHWHGGQITGNARAIQSINQNAQNIRFAGANIASTTTAPAVLISGVVRWEIDCWFEVNAAGTAVVQLGDATATASACWVHSHFVESAAITYGVQVQNGTGNNIDHCYNGSPFTGAFVRVEANGAQTAVGPNLRNTGSTVPWISDASSGNDTRQIPAEPNRAVGAAGQPAFQANWANQGGGQQPLIFYKDSDGQLHIEGVFTNTAATAAGVTIFQLPAGYLPTSTKTVSAVNYSTTPLSVVQVQVTPAGLVVMGPALAISQILSMDATVRLP